jgi:UDP-GlcNAc:undecaprenyl-phosphate/decaprenyl-phosphate GlcNAc-1-phosphate transferase
MEFALVIAVSAAVGLIATRLVRDYAPRLGLVDAPDGRRKLQARAVPVGGGLAVLLAALAGTAVAAVVLPGVRVAVTDHWDQAIAVFTATVLIAALGLADDAYDLRARYKLAGQLVAVLILVLTDCVRLQKTSLLGTEIDLGLLAIPVTCLWLLAAINAINLLDGMDGLLGTVGLIVFGALAVMAYLTTHPLAGAVSLAMCGGLIGFLRYNLPPASIYLGDTGSMLIGLVVGAVALKANMKSHTVALIAPTALLVLPFLDTTAAIVRRQLSGRGWAAADREHLHHVLLRGGLTVRRVLLLVAACGIVAATGALVGLRYRNDLISLVTAGGVVLMLAATGLFGSAELRLIRQRAAAALASARGRQPTVLEVRVLAGTPWPAVWSAVTQAATDARLISVSLESYDGREPFRRSWSVTGPTPDSAELWRAELALRDRGRPVGRILVCGPWDADPMAVKLAVLSQAVETAAGVESAVTPAPSVVVA